MSNAKIKVGVLGQIKAFLANTKKETKETNVPVSAPVTIVEYVEPELSEEEKLEAFLTKEETDLLAEDKRHIGVNETATKEALQSAKIAAAVAKLKSDSAARVAKAKLLANDAVAKAEKAVLEDLVETQKLADRVASYNAEEQLLANRMAAIRSRRIHDMDIVAAHMAGDNDRAEQARQAAILLADRNTSVTSQVTQSYTNAGNNSSNPPAEEKKAAKWPVALAALQASGFSEKQAKRIIDSSKTEASVTGYVEAIVAKDPKRAAEAAVIAGVLNDPAVDYYAKNWKKYLVATNSSSNTSSGEPTATTPPARPTVLNQDPFNTSAS